MTIEIVAVRPDGYDFKVVDPLETLSSNDIGDDFLDGGWVPA
jgi:hypothetical protein